MKKENINSYDTIDRDDQNEIVIKDLLALCFKNRFWFMLSAIICVALGVVYVKTKPNIYSRTATVLVKDDRAGGALGEAAAFQELFSSGGNSVHNEIGLFGSYRYMLEVVNRLNLAVSYRQRESLRTTELYKATPLKATFSDMLPSQNLSFKAKAVDSTSVHIFDLKIIYENDVIDVDLDCVVPYGEQILTDVGSFAVTPTLFMDEAYIGVPIYITKSDPELVATMYKTKLGVVLVDRYAALIDISISDENVNRAEDIINTIIQVYKDDAIYDKNTILSNTAAFIDERLNIIESELDLVDEEIETYKKTNKLTDILSESSLYLESVSRIDNEAMAIANQLSVIEYMKSYLEDDANIDKPLPVNIGIQESSLQAQIYDYNTFLAKRNKLKNNSSERNPIVVDLQNTLSDLRSSINYSINNLIQTLKIQVTNFEKREMESRSKIKDIPSQQKYIISVERQQKIKSELYLYLLNKKEESELQLSINESNCRIVDAAEGPKRPVSPQKMMIVFFAFIIGILIPGVWLYIKSILNTFVVTRKDIKGVVSIPFLGDVPLEKESGDNGVCVFEGSRSATSEALKIVHDNIEFMNVDNNSGCKVIQLTSFNPGSGKTFVSINLAESIALSGLKVLIVDLDIRKGTLSKTAGIGIAVPGVTQYLSGKISSYTEIIRPFYANSSLQIMTAGAIPPNPAELLKGDKLSNMIEELRESYDYIFIDNPPYSVVVDAAICSRLCDQTIYVIRSGKFDKRLLPDIQDLYDANKMPNMGILLNAVDFAKNEYSYGYGNYGYGGYGYGSDDKPKLSVWGWIKRIIGL